MASELASSKWLLPQIDLHRWEEVFQVGTGTTPDREGRQREEEPRWSGEKRHKGLSGEPDPGELEKSFERLGSCLSQSHR